MILISLLIGPNSDIAKLFNCGVKKKGNNKFVQSALKQGNCIINFIEIYSYNQC